MFTEPVTTAMVGVNKNGWRRRKKSSKIEHDPFVPQTSKVYDEGNLSIVEAERDYPNPML